MSDLSQDIYSLIPLTSIHEASPLYESQYLILYSNIIQNLVWASKVSHVHNLKFSSKHVEKMRKKKKVKLLVAEPCPALCNRLDCGPPGSYIHGILQVTILEWVAISFSRGSSWPRDQTLIPCIANAFLKQIWIHILIFLSFF